MSGARVRVGCVVVRCKPAWLPYPSLHARPAQCVRRWRGRWPRHPRMWRSSLWASRIRGEACMARACTSRARLFHSDPSQVITPVNVRFLLSLSRRETTVVWDKSTGRPLHNAIVWHDTRTSDICHEIEARGAFHGHGFLCEMQLRMLLSLMPYRHTAMAPVPPLHPSTRTTSSAHPMPPHPSPPITHPG